jgi:hypothetical protein
LFFLGRTFVTACVTNDLQSQPDCL